MLNIHGCVICFVVQIKMQAHEDLLTDVIQSHQELSNKHEQILNVSLRLCSWIVGNSLCMPDADHLIAMQDVFCCVLFLVLCACLYFAPLPHTAKVLLSVETSLCFSDANQAGQA